jgi:hypothetical protein
MSAELVEVKTNTPGMIGPVVWVKRPMSFGRHGPENGKNMPFRNVGKYLLVGNA